jgi:hypothetical protein
MTRGLFARLFERVPSTAYPVYLVYFQSSGFIRIHTDQLEGSKFRKA